MVLYIYTLIEKALDLIKLSNESLPYIDEGNTSNKLIKGMLDDDLQPSINMLHLEITIFLKAMKRSQKQHRNQHHYHRLNEVRKRLVRIQRFNFHDIILQFLSLDPRDLELPMYILQGLMSFIEETCKVTIQKAAHSLRGLLLVGFFLDYCIVIFSMLARLRELLHRVHECISSLYYVFSTLYIMDPTQENTHLHEDISVLINEFKEEFGPLHFRGTLDLSASSTIDVKGEGRGLRIEGERGNIQIQINEGVKRGEGKKVLKLEEGERRSDVPFVDISTSTTKQLLTTEQHLLFLPFEEEQEQEQTPKNKATLESIVVTKYKSNNSNSKNNTTTTTSSSSGNIKRRESKYRKKKRKKRKKETKQQHHHHHHREKQQTNNNTKQKKTKSNSDFDNIFQSLMSGI